MRLLLLTEKKRGLVARARPRYWKECGAHWLLTAGARATHPEPHRTGSMAAAAAAAAAPAAEAKVAAAAAARPGILLGIGNPLLDISADGTLHPLSTPLSLLPLLSLLLYSLLFLSSSLLSP